MPEKPGVVVVMGTMDTKGPEMAYLAQQVTLAGCRTLLMDVGVHEESDIKAHIPGFLEYLINLFLSSTIRVDIITHIVVVRTYIVKIFVGVFTHLYFKFRAIHCNPSIPRNVIRIG